MAPAPAGEGNSTAEVPQITREPIWSQSKKPRKQARGAKRHKIDGLPLLVITLEEYNIDNTTLQFFKFSWRPSTRNNYVTHINRWALWALEQGVKVLDPPIVEVLKYLRIYFETGVGYGAIKVARCVLSLILPRAKNGQTVVEHFLIKMVL